MPINRAPVTKGKGHGKGKEKGKRRLTGKKKGEEKKPGRKIDCVYNIYLQDDTNADSALFQWYYFSCMNIQQGTTMKINICNLSKPNGLYAKGMKPFVYSVNRNKADPT